MSVIGSNALAGASGQGGGGFVIENSLRFKGASDASLTRTPTTAGSQSAFTLSTWVKRSLSTTYEYLMWTTTSFYINFTSGDKLDIALYAPNGSSWAVIATSQARFRDPNAWYHIVVSVDSSAGTTNADRLKLWVNGVESPLDYAAYWGGLITGNISTVNTTIQHEIGARSGYACDFYLADYHWIDGQGLTQNDFGAFDDNGVWQAAEYTGTYGTNGFHLDFADGNDIGNDAAGSNNWTVNNLTATGGTVNYAEAISGSPYIPFNAFSTSYISNYVNTSTWAITNAAWDGAWDSSGNTNVFTPSGGIAVSSSLIVYYGNYNNAASTTTLTITYTDSSTETDTFTSGSSNWMGSFTASNAAGKTIQSIQVVGPSSAAYQSFGGFVIDGQILTSANPNADILRDSPTNGDATADIVSGNYCTFNPLANYGTLSDGNLNVAQTSVAHTTTYGTLGVSSGKWYWEIYKDDGNNYSGTSGGIGVAATEYTANGSGYLGSNYTNVAYFQSGVQLYDGSDGYESLTTVLGSGEEHKKGTWMLAFDFDSGKGWVGKNGVWLSDTTAGNEGNPATGANPCFNAFVSGANYVPMVGMYASQSFTANFGARPFAYTAPSGFKALCTTNLPTPTIADGSTAFDAVLYSGTGNAQSITGLGFSPDLVWTKNRGASASHAVYDSVRGAGELIRTNETSAEVTVSSRFTSFDSNGFSIGSTSTENNASSNTYVSWAWDAGSSTVSNTDGDITSSVRANQTAGFSIVKWTSPTWSGSPQSVGHGLNAAPAFIITKGLENAGSWYCYHKDLDASNPQTKYILLNDTGAAGTLANSWGTSAPDSNVFGDRLLGWSEGQDVIAYCFSPVKNYSAFGSYIGNGSNDGQLVYTNFKVRYLLTKPAFAGGDWMIWDAKREPFNVNPNTIQANASAAEAGTGGYSVDFLSNGFKFRMYGSSSNASGVTYIYAAFAEHPFQANGGLAR